MPKKIIVETDFLVHENPHIWNFQLMRSSWHFWPNRRVDPDTLPLQILVVEITFSVLENSDIIYFKVQRRYWNFRKNRRVDPHSYIGKFFASRFIIGRVKNPQGENFIELYSFKKCWFFDNTPLQPLGNIEVFFILETISPYFKNRPYTYFRRLEYSRAIGTKIWIGVKGVCRFWNTCF